MSWNDLLKSSKKEWGTGPVGPVKKPMTYVMGFAFLCSMKFERGLGEIPQEKRPMAYVMGLMCVVSLKYVRISFVLPTLFDAGR